MPKITGRTKAATGALSAASPPLGGSLATLGFARSVPLLRGSLDCIAFPNVHFARHLQEPIAGQVSASHPAHRAMAPDENVVEGIRTVAEKSEPDLITVLSTAQPDRPEMDSNRWVREFRERYPEFAKIGIVAVNTPESSGCIEAGYAATITEIIDQLVPPALDAGTRPGIRLRQLNVLVSSMLTPGDLGHLRDIIELFGLRPVFVPDISDSLDTHRGDADLSPASIGGTPVHELATLGNGVATLAVGPSLHRAADLLEERTGVSSYRLDHLYGLAATDELMSTLQRISGTRIPDRLQRQRAQLQAALEDVDFAVGLLRVGIAADPDQLNGMCRFILEIGGEIAAAVASADGPALATLPQGNIALGKHVADIEGLAGQDIAAVLVGNQQAVDGAERLGVPILRCGFPLYELVGGTQQTTICYAGARQMLFDLATLTLAHRHPREIAATRASNNRKPPEKTTKNPPRHRSAPRLRPPRADHSNPEPKSMPASQKIAFATDDVRQVNQRFSSARTFAVYAVEPHRAELLKAAQFGVTQDQETLTAKIKLLDGCAAVYCESIGASAIRQLMASGIQPIKVYRGAPIAELIDDFQNELQNGPMTSMDGPSTRSGKPGACP